MTDNQPPEEIQIAARKVDNWLKGQPPIAGSQQPQQRPESAAERFKRARDIDQSKMPEWRDPRGKS
jgi:hypothetical protein